MNEPPALPKVGTVMCLTACPGQHMTVLRTRRPGEPRDVEDHTEPHVGAALVAWITHLRDLRMEWLPVRALMPDPGWRDADLELENT